MAQPTITRAVEAVASGRDLSAEQAEREHEHGDQPEEDHPRQAEPEVDLVPPLLQAVGRRQHGQVGGEYAAAQEQGEARGQEGHRSPPGRPASQQPRRHRKRDRHGER